MKFIKLAVIISAITLFLIACNNQADTNQTTSSTTTNTSVTQSSPAASVASANTNAATPVADELTDARATYARECSICHGDDGEGGIVKTEFGKLKVPTFKAGHALRHTDEQFAKQITNGGDGMPPFKDKLKADEISQLVRFIRKEFQSGGAAATTTPASAATPLAVPKT